VHGQRDCTTDYRYDVINPANAYEPIAERLRDAVARSGATRIVDLRPGGGGAWLRREPALDARDPASVKALHVPPGLTGFRRSPRRSIITPCWWSRLL